MSHEALPFQHMVPAKSIVDHTCSEYEDGGGELYKHQTAFWAVTHARVDVLQEMLCRSLLLLPRDALIMQKLCGYALHGDKKDIVALFLNAGMPASPELLSMCVPSNATKCFEALCSAAKEHCKDSIVPLALDACAIGASGILEIIFAWVHLKLTDDDITVFLRCIRDAVHLNDGTKCLVELHQRGWTKEEQEEKEEEEKEEEGEQIAATVVNEPVQVRRSGRSRKPTTRLVVDHGTGWHYGYEKTK